jgi:hypothetical protein
MEGSARKTGAVSSLRVILALVCVLLVVLSGTIGVVHSHAGSDDGHANCSLCLAAHVTVHLSQAQTPEPAAPVFARVTALPPVEIRSSFSAFSYFTRPPPSLNLPA